MKRGTRQHPKFKALRAMLGVDEAHAVGVLESLWMAVEEFQDDGAVGRWSDLRIAGAIGWAGDARQLVMALVECEWLDRAEGADRLVIHDWLTHCANHVWKRVRTRIDRATKAGRPVERWLLQMRDKAAEERSRNQDRGDAPGEEDDVPDRVETGQRRTDRAEVCRSVPQRAATGGPDPRPRTQDPGPEGQPAAQAAGGETRPEAGSPTPPGPEDPVVLIFPTDGSTRRWDLRTSLVAQLSSRFPSLDVEAECRAALAFVEAKPQNRKTPGGMQQYLTSWLTRSQNNPRMRARPEETAPTHLDAIGRPPDRRQRLSEALRK